MAPKYKLTYFPIRALGEPIRFILSYMGADFEDNRVEYSDWPKLKPSTPYGKIPYLEIDGKILCQSVAICRYLAKKAKLAGDNDWENFNIDMAVDVFKDLMADMIAVLKEPVETKKAERLEKLKKEIAPPQLEKLDKLVKDNGGYVANKKLSWGDFYVVGVIEFLSDRTGIDVYKYPHIKTLHNNVVNIPSIKAWIKKRPQDKRRP